MLQKKRILKLGLVKKLILNAAKTQFKMYSETKPLNLNWLVLLSWKSLLFNVHYKSFIVRRKLLWDGMK